MTPFPEHQVKNLTTKFTKDQCLELMSSNPDHAQEIFNQIKNIKGFKDNQNSLTKELLQNDQIDLEVKKNIFEHYLNTTKPQTKIDDSKNILKSLEQDDKEELTKIFCKKSKEKEINQLLTNTNDTNIINSIGEYAVENKKTDLAMKVIIKKGKDENEKISTFHQICTENEYIDIDYKTELLQKFIEKNPNLQNKEGILSKFIQNNAEQLGKSNRNKISQLSDDPKIAKQLDNATGTRENYKKTNKQKNHPRKRIKRIKKGKIRRRRNKRRKKAKKASNVGAGLGIGGGIALAANSTWEGTKEVLTGAGSKLKSLFSNFPMGTIGGALLCAAAIVLWPVSTGIIGGACALNSVKHGIKNYEARKKAKIQQQHPPSSNNTQPQYQQQNINQTHQQAQQNKQQFQNQYTPSYKSQSRNFSPGSTPPNNQQTQQNNKSSTRIF